MECLYPPNTKLSDTEKANINYSAFPDSNSGCMGDTVYHFRLRCKSFLKQTEMYSCNYPDYIKPVPNHCLGFVKFRQVRDKSIRRGYFQKSVVVISALPLVNFFYKVVELVADAYFQDGEVGLEVACHNIDCWEPPSAGKTMNLPLRGVVLQTQLPVQLLEADTMAVGSSVPDRNNSSIAKQSSAAVKVESGKQNDFTAKSVRIRASFIERVEKNNIENPQPLPGDTVYFLASPHNLNCFTAFGSVINQLQLLWELILTNQPVLVIASSPVISAMIVQSLVTSIAPLQFANDYRPFFTIHDSEFKEYTTKSTAPPQIILGITNPFFVKALSHWPNILKVTDVKLGAPNGISRDRHLKSPNYLLRQDEIKPGLYSHYKQLLQPNKAFISSITKGLKIERPSVVQSEIIRKFFLELTQSFMYPLERYVTSLMPLKREVSPFRGVPLTKTFNIDDFLKSLEFNGPQLTTGIKGDWVGLYRLFYASPNFVAWFSQRQKAISVKLVKVHTDILCHTDLTTWIVNKPEVELVDFIIQINNKIRDCRRQKIGIPGDQLKLLQRHVDTVMSALPPDLQEIVARSASGTGAPHSP